MLYQATDTQISLKTYNRQLELFFRPFYVQYRLRYCTHPLAFPWSGDAASASRFRSRECTTFGAFPQAGTGTEIITNLRLRGCNILVAFPQAELSALDSIPARGKCKFSCVSPLAGTVHRNNYTTSACGDAIFWLHFRKRRLSALDYFCAPSPRAEMHMKIYMCISARGNTMHRNNYKVSACGDVKFWLHSRKRNCRFWIVFPRGVNVNFYVHLRFPGGVLP